MMLLWNMLFNKKKNKKAETAAEEEKLIEFVVPETTITESEIPQHDPSVHDNFNVIKNGKDNLMYRLISDKSKEIMRLTCTGHEYTFDYISRLTGKDLFSYDAQYMKGDFRYHFITRVFVTDNGKYFYQYIRSNGTAAYDIQSKADIQALLKKCESTEKIKYFDRTDGYNYWPAIPGTYTKDTFKTVDTCCRNHDEFIDSYEIINKELYDKIIDVL